MHPELPPQAMLMNLISGKWATYTIGAAVELGLVDALKDGATSSDDVARARTTNADATYRTLRALSLYGIVTEDQSKRFTLTAIGQLLRSDVPGSLAGMALFQASTWHSQAWSDGLAHSIRTGESGFTHVHGMNAWDWGTAHPTQFGVFQSAMTSFSASVAGAVVASYDFSSVNRMQDVGGGHGLMLKTILDANPKVSGVLFDRPDVVAGAKQVLGPVAGRCEVVGGDFLKSVPAGADCVMLKHIIHDWNDKDAETILRNCAHGLAPNGRVLVVETLMPAAGVPHFAKALDLEMLVVTTGGRERTQAEFAELFNNAGLKLERVVATPAPISIIEARKA